MNARAVETQLTTKVIGRSIVWQDRLSSTNTVAREMAFGGAQEGLVVGAELQTAGRGRFQREWVSEAGENLLFSIVLRPPFSDEHIPLLNVLASLAVANAVGLYPGVCATVRWPNDVYLGGKKLSGILAERTGDHVILGIGVNVNQREFPQEIQNATSLALVAGETLERDRLLHLLLRELDDQYMRALENGFVGIMDDWRALCDMGGSEVTVQTGNSQVTGAVVGIEDDGALIIRDDRGVEHRMYAGDATLHKSGLGVGG